MKKILITISAIILICIVFIIIESIRLENGKEPLIIIGECDKTLYAKDSYITDCKSIGFSLKREYAKGGMTKENNKYIETKREFYLFNKYLMWGWTS